MSTISAEVLNDGCVRISSKPTNKTRTFAREWIFSYRNVRNTKFVEWERKTVAANTDAGTVTSNVGGSEQQLTPNNLYEFKVEIRNKSTGESLETKSIQARTAEATGTLTLTYNSESDVIEIEISGLKPTAYYNRTIYLYYYSEGHDKPHGAVGWHVYAGETAGTLSKRRAYLQHGEFYGFSVKVFRGEIDDDESASAYKVIDRQDIFVPYDDISTAEITSVTQTGMWEYEVEWEITREIEETIDTTHFSLWLDVPGNGPALWGEVVGSETTSMTVNLWWLLQGSLMRDPTALVPPKKSELFIHAEESSTTSRFESQRVPVTTSLLFFWTEEDKEKYVWPSENYFSRQAGDDFNITAEDWNKMAYGLWELIQYQDLWTDLYQIPKPLYELEYQDLVDLIFVDSGDELTAAKSNLVPYGPGVDASVQWYVSNSKNMYTDGYTISLDANQPYSWDISNTSYNLVVEQYNIVGNITVDWIAPLTYYVPKGQSALDITGYSVISQRIFATLSTIAATAGDVVDAHTMNRYLQVINHQIRKGLQP